MDHGQQRFREASQRAQETMRRMSENATRRMYEETRRQQESTRRWVDDSNRRWRDWAAKQHQKAVEDFHRRLEDQVRRPWPWELYWLKRRQKQASQWSREIQVPPNPSAFLTPPSRTPLTRGIIVTAVLVAIAILIALMVSGRVATPTAKVSTAQQSIERTTPTGMVRVVTIDGLNIRSAPKQNQNTFIRELRKGEQVTLLDDAVVVSDGITWVHVRAGNTTGWVSQKYLK